jgi:hypothetical protein
MGESEAGEGEWGPGKVKVRLIKVADDERRRLSFFLFPV